MITTAAAVLLCSIAAAGTAAPSAPPAPAPAVHASTAAVPSASAAAAFGVSTYTVSTLYTGDQVRDPFLPPGRPVMSIQSSSDAGDSGGKKKSQGVDIHALELRGIMKDADSAFAIFSTDTGATLILRGNRLFDEHNKRVPGITGSINIKQKRAVLITADKDRQPYHLGESDAGNAKDAQPDAANESEETGSGRSP